MPGGWRRWMVTDNELVRNPLWLEKPAGVRYVVWQLEKAPSTGHLHYQIYAVFNESITLGTVKSVLGMPAAHCEQARGKHEECVAYCKKEESRESGPWELGDPTEVGQGKRNDLKQLTDMVAAGQPDYEIAAAEPVAYARYAKNVAAFRSAIERPAMRNLDVTVLWGPTGTGKTYWAHAVCERRGMEIYPVVCSASRIWWDGYYGQDAVLFDDFDDANIPITHLLRYLDRYPLRLEVKGSTVVAKYHYVIITANTDPKDWFAWATPAHRAALMRRLTTIVEVKKLGDLDPSPPSIGGQQEEAPTSN